MRGLRCFPRDSSGRNSVEYAGSVGIPTTPFAGALGTSLHLVRVTGPVGEPRSLVGTQAAHEQSWQREPSAPREVGWTDTRACAAPRRPASLRPARSKTEFMIGFESRRSAIDAGSWLLIGGVQLSALLGCSTVTRSCYSRAGDGAATNSRPCHGGASSSQRCGSAIGAPRAREFATATPWSRHGVRTHGKGRRPLRARRSPCACGQFGRSPSGATVGVGGGAVATVAMSGTAGPDRSGA